MNTMHLDKHFLLEAKLGPNEWFPVWEVYPHSGLHRSFACPEEAHRAKSKLKSLLLGAWKGKYHKRPIRIRAVERIAD